MITSCLAWLEKVYRSVGSGGYDALHLCALDSRLRVNHHTLEQQAIVITVVVDTTYDGLTTARRTQSHVGTIFVNTVHAGVGTVAAIMHEPAPDVVVLATTTTTTATTTAAAAAATTTTTRGH